MWSKLGMPEKVALSGALVFVVLIAFLAWTGWVGWLLLIGACLWFAFSAVHLTYASWAKRVDDLIPDSYDEAKAMAARFISEGEAIAREVRGDIKDLSGRAAALAGTVEQTARAEWAQMQSVYAQATTPATPAAPEPSPNTPPPLPATMPAVTNG